MMPGTDTTDTTDPDAPLGRRIMLARQLATRYAILTADQRAQIGDALRDALDEIYHLASQVETLERDLADNRAGWEQALKLSEDACEMLATDGPATEFDADEWRAEMTRALAKTDDIAEAIGLTLGAASMCWENPAGAGTFESQRASVLVDVLVAYLDRVHPDLSTYLDAAHGLICNAHSARVDDVTEADGASPGWAEAARKWIDAYPPKVTHDGHAEFAAEVGRLREEHLRGQAIHAIAERDRAQHQLAIAREQLAQRDADIAKRIDRNRELRAERDKAVHQLGQATDQLNAIRTVLNPDRDNPGDSWVDHVHQRAEQARKLRATPGQVVHVVRDYSTGQDHHVRDYDATEQATPGPHQGPTLEQLRAEVEGLIAERLPGPRPKPRPRPTPATRPPATTGDATATVADLRATGLADGLIPFDPDYTEADVAETPDGAVCGVEKRDDHGRVLFVCEVVGPHDRHRDRAVSWPA